VSSDGVAEGVLMSPLMSPCARRDRQRGAIGLLAALTMALALLCTLVVVDSGRLYMEKRSLQRVADMAALEAASLNGTCAGANTASRYATQSATRNGFTVTDNTRTLTTRCGLLATGADSRRSFVVDATKSDAIQVIVSHTVDRSIAAGIGAMFDTTPTPTDIQLTAVAVATPPLPPLAQLTIRSSLLSVNIDQSKANSLNAGLSRLLGTTVALDAGSWKGLVDSDLSLLKLADQAAIKANVNAGDYTKLLNTDITLTDLLGASVSAMQQSGATATIAAAISGLTAVQTAVKSSGIGSSLIKLGDVVNLKTGTPDAGLDAGVQAFQLVQTLAQIANGQNGVALSQVLSVPGVGQVSASIKLIEPPQLSAIGDPRTEPEKITVRTAQMRALLTIDLTSLSAPLNKILKAVPLVSVTVAPSPIDVSIELAPAITKVTGYNCDSDTTKTLRAQTSTAIATVKAGVINHSDWESSTVPTSVSSLNLATLSVPLVGTTALGVSVDAPVGSTTTPSTGDMLFNVPNEIGMPANPFLPLKAQDLVKGLGASKVQVSFTGVLSILGGLINALVGDVGSLLTDFLSPLLDPVLNGVLDQLGISLANVNVGANLSCHPGQAVLVM
jgi:uncharacterized membrane protein